MRTSAKAILLTVVAVSFVFCMLSSESDASAAADEYGSADVGAHTVTFDTAGGTGGYSQHVLNGNTIYLPTEYKASGTANISYDQISYAGYVLTGWKLDGTDTIYYPGDDYKVYGDVRFVAQWKDLTFNSIAGTVKQSGHVVSEITCEAYHTSIALGSSYSVTRSVSDMGFYYDDRALFLPNTYCLWTLNVSCNNHVFSGSAYPESYGALTTVTADWLTLTTDGETFTFSGTPDIKGYCLVEVTQSYLNYPESDDIVLRLHSYLSFNIADPDNDPSNICHVTYGSYDTYGPYGTAVKLPDRDSSVKYQNGWNITVKGSPAVYPIGGSYTVELKEMPLTASTYDADSVITSGVVGVIAYNANGGYYNGAIADLVASEGTAVLKNSSSVTKSGYTFLGWNKTGLATDPIYPAGYVYSVEGEYTELKAVWGNPTGSTVNLYCNNPGNGDQNVTYTVYPGYTYVLPVNGFSKTGYNFLGWSRTSYALGTGTADAGTSVKIDATTTYYAVFEPKTYTYKITFMANNGTSDSTTIDGISTVVPFSVDLIDCPGSWTYEGYAFAGWAETKYAASPAFLSNGQYTFNDSGEVVLYAVWSENIYTYKITFMANNGTSDSITDEGTSNTVPFDVTLTDCPWTYEKHNFAGWSKNKDAANPQYLGNGTYRFTDSETVTFYAVWSESGTKPEVEEEDRETVTKYLFLITFNGNGSGVTNVPPQMYKTITSTTATFQLPSYGPQKTGYNFSGWSKDPESTTKQYSPGQTVTMEIPGKATQVIWTLYAVWSVKDGGSGGTSGDSGTSVTVDFIVDNGVYRSVSTKTGQTVTKPVASSKAGYAFLGWYDGDTAWDFSDPVTGDMTLSAKYLPIFDIEISGTSVTVKLKVASSLTKVSFSDGFTGYYTTSSIPAHPVAENSTGKVTVTVKTEQGDFSAYRNYTVAGSGSASDEDEEEKDNGGNGGENENGDEDEKEKSFDLDTVETVAVCIVGLLAIFVIARRLL